MRKFILYAVLMLTANSFAQQTDSADCAGMLKKAGFLLGDWRGSGWMGLSSDQREYFDQSYLIHSKLNGALILVEGNRAFVKKESGEPDTTFNSLWTLAWYINMNRYNIMFFRDDGIYESTGAAFPEPNRMTWESKNPRLGILRYSMAINSEGNLVQTGEAQEYEGGSWIKIVEVVLKKAR